MNKRKRQSKPTPQNPSLKDFFGLYDSVTLIAMMNSLEQSTVWKVFQAYSATVQRQYEVDSLDKTGKGEYPQASFASGYAKACEDMGMKFMEGLKQTALNVSPVVENDRVEEKEPATPFD